MMFDVNDPPLRQLGDSGRERRRGFCACGASGTALAADVRYARRRPAYPKACSSPPPLLQNRAVNRLWTVLPAQAGLTYMDMPLLQTTIDSIQKNQARLKTAALRVYVYIVYKCMHAWHAHVQAHWSCMVVRLPVPFPCIWHAPGPDPAPQGPLPPPPKLPRSGSGRCSGGRCSSLTRCGARRALFVIVAGARWNAPSKSSTPNPTYKGTHTPQNLHGTPRKTHRRSWRATAATSTPCGGSCCRAAPSSGSVRCTSTFRCVKEGGVLHACRLACLACDRGCPLS